MPFFNGECKSKARLDNKTALVTGCNTGIGKETVLDFYKRGARVLMACRNLEKAEEAKLYIEKACGKHPNVVGKLILLKLDLTSLKSVRECAQHVLDTEPQLNILVNNAGIMICPQGETEEGFETQFGTNHLAHFLLTLLLLPRIKSSTPARIVTVSSMAHERGKIDFEDLHFKNRPYSAINAYGQSKLANILFSKELAVKLKEHNIDGVNTYSLHPGVIKTDLDRHMDDTVFRGARWIYQNVAGMFMKTPVLGAQTQIYCAVDEKCANETGLYYSDCVAVKPTAKAQSDEDAKRLWEVSAKLVGLENVDPFTLPDEGIKTKFNTQQNNTE